MDGVQSGTEQRRDEWRTDNLLSTADTVAVRLAVAVVLVALSNRAAAQLPAHRTVPLSAATHQQCHAAVTVKLCQHTAFNCQGLGTVQAALMHGGGRRGWSTDPIQALLVCGLTSSPMLLLRQCSQKRRVQSLLQHASIPLARTCARHAPPRHAPDTRRAASKWQRRVSVRRAATRACAPLQLGHNSLGSTVGHSRCFGGQGRASCCTCAELETRPHRALLLFPFLPRPRSP